MKKSSASWSNQAFWTLAEHGSTRVLDALLTIVLIRVFSTEQFGLFSIYQSWTGIALLFLPSLELALYRDYGHLKKQAVLERELSVYRRFNYFKMLIALCFATALSFIPNDLSWPMRLSLVVFAFALPLSQSFYGFLREILRFEMKTKLVAVVSALQRVFLIAAIVAVARYLPNDARAISITAITIYVVFGFLWSIPVSKLFSLGSKGFHEYGSRIRSILSTTVLWIHLNGVLSQFIQTLDTFFLGNLGYALEDVGLYSITLKCANFFQVLPVALVNPFGVFLGRTAADSDIRRERALLSKMVFGFGVLSVLLFFVGVLFAEDLLKIVGKGKIHEGNLSLAQELFLWQLGGVLLFCSTHPLSTYLGARYSLKGVSLQVIVPWLLASAAIYGAAAWKGGILWAAYANVPVYLLFLLLLIRGGLRIPFR